MLFVSRTVQARCPSNLWLACVAYMYAVFWVVDNHTILGKTTLPATLNHFMKLVVASSPESLDDAQTLAAYELLRVGANLCMDHGKYVFALVGR